MPDLHHVQTVDGVMRTKSGTTTPITYAEYFELLHDAAFHHDRALKTTNEPRQACVHALEPVDPIRVHEVDSTPVHTYDMFMNSIKPSIPKELVKSFLPETLWKQISAVDRKLIIEYNRKIPSKKPTSATPPPHQQVKLHTQGPPEPPEDGSTPVLTPIVDQPPVLTHFLPWSSDPHQ